MFSGLIWPSICCWWILLQPEKSLKGDEFKGGCKIEETFVSTKFTDDVENN